jgi:Ca2+-binding RTX toxin-like protein
MIRRVAVVALLAAGVLAVPAPAWAAPVATASLQGNILSYKAGVGQANRVTMSGSEAAGFVVTDVVTITPGPGCTRTAATRVVCRGPIDTALAVLGDRDDTAKVTLVSTFHVIHGEAGRDTLTAGPAVWSLLDGGDGDDHLIGGTGHDRLQGGAGADVMEGGSAAPGGRADSDIADYHGRTESIWANLNGDADDGAIGEGDRIATDVEALSGGSGNDFLVGDDRPNTLYGMNGDDWLYGFGGDDDLDGGDLGADYVFGGPGNDRMWGYGGADSMYGEEGDDTLRGGAGYDHLDGNAGSDDCDPGADDATIVDCRRVTLP